MGRKGVEEEEKAKLVRIVLNGTMSVQAAAVAAGVSRTTIYNWIGDAQKRSLVVVKDSTLHAENLRLRRELRRIKEERDILKKAALLFAR